MAFGEVTGWTYPEVLEKKEKHQDNLVSEDWDFEETFCLIEIGKQPDDYDGPQRFCGNYTETDGRKNHRSPQCRFHGGWNEGGKESTLFEEGNTHGVKHGMYTEDANLKKEFSEADEKLFDRIMSWADEWGWEEGDPAHMVLEDLALSKVREMRSEKYLNENGEIITRTEFDPTTGERKEEEDTHPLKNDLRLQKKTILDMMKELGLTPKAKAQMDNADKGATALEDIATIADSALDQDDEDYDPEQFGE